MSNLRKLTHVLVAMAVGTIVVAVVPATPAAAAACQVVDYTPYNGGRAYATNSDGRQEWFGRGPVGYDYVLHDYQNDNLNWTGFSYRLGGETIGKPTAVRNRDNRLVVFVVGTDHQIYFNYQTNPGSSWDWHGWVNLGGYASANPLALVNHDGRIEVFIRGSDNALHHRWQNLDYSWSDWVTLGGGLTSFPWGERSSDGKLVINVRGTDCYHHSIWQTSPGGSWSSWHRWNYIG